MVRHAINVIANSHFSNNRITINVDKYQRKRFAETVPIYLHFLELTIQNVVCVLPTVTQCCCKIKANVNRYSNDSTTVNSPLFKYFNSNL